MPFSKCPICGMVAHLNVSDVQAWYAERYPDRPVGSLVPARCIYCWPELKVGEQVILRSAIVADVHRPPGTRGVIREIISSEDGNLYLVALDGGNESYLIRAEIRKPQDGEA